MFSWCHQGLWLENALSICENLLGEVVVR